MNPRAGALVLQTAPLAVLLGALAWLAVDPPDTAILPPLAAFLTALALWLIAVLAVARRRESADAPLRALGDNLPHAYLYQYQVDARGTARFLHISSGVERVHGVSAAAVLADPARLLDLTHPDDRAAILAAETESQRHGTPFELTLRARRADGLWGWLHLHSVPHAADDGSVTWDGLATDVTRERENSRALRMVARRVEALLALPEEAERLDEPALLHGALTRAAELTGSRTARLYRIDARGQLSSVPEDEAPFPAPAGSAGAEALRLGTAVCRNQPDAPLPGLATPSRVVCLPVADEGAAQWLALLANRDEDYTQAEIDTLRLIVGQAWQLAKKRKATQALLLANRVLNASSVICFRWRAEAGWPVDYVSPNVRQWGYTAEALCAGRPPFADLVHPDDLARVADEVVAHTAAGRTGYLQEYRIRTACGDLRWVLDETRVLRDADGTALAYDGILTDITDRRRAEEAMQQALAEQQALNRKLEEAHTQLLQSEKLASIGQLAAGVAHELNNPLGFVISNLGTLDTYLRDLMAVVDAGAALLDEAQRARLAPVCAAHDFDYVRGDAFTLIAESREGLDRLRRIVQDLKTFSRPGDSEWREADLNQGLESTLNIVWNELKYKCTVHRDLGELPPVRCRIAQLNQVFLNLLVNAGQAIAERGEITLRTRAAGESVTIEISDTGCGISPEHRQRIFDPFFTTKPVGQGTGLGLSLAYGIIRAHQGRIEVDSTPGQGSTFRIVLPLAPAGPPDDGVVSEGAPAPGAASPDPSPRSPA